MGRDRKKLDESQVLSGWKDISNYLGKGVRTVQRYESQFGLPVRRPAAKTRGSVVATKAELDAWVAASPMRDALYLTRPTLSSDGSATRLKDGVARMILLRDQMAALRDEIRSSIYSLGESIRSVRDDLTYVKPEFQNQKTRDLLDARFTGRKAS